MGAEDVSILLGANFKVRKNFKEYFFLFLSINIAVLVINYVKYLQKYTHEYQNLFQVANLSVLAKLVIQKLFILFSEKI